MNEGSTKDATIVVLVVILLSLVIITSVFVLYVDSLSDQTWEKELCDECYVHGLMEGHAGMPHNTLADQNDQECYDKGYYSNESLKSNGRSWQGDNNV
jgi:hypothetical protein